MRRWASGLLLAELLRCDDRPIRIQIRLHRVIVVASLPELGLPDSEAAFPGLCLLVEDLTVTGAADLGQLGDLIRIVHHVEHLVGVMSHLAVLELAVVT
jgi:hypothetical protein